MAIKKIRMRPEGTNDYADVLHPETSAEQVIMNSGETLENTIDTHLSESVTQAHMPKNVGLGNVDNVKQASKTEFDVHNNDSVKHITALERNLWNTVDNKVDKVTGKGLSSNDYTTAEKNKLSGIQAGANNYIHPAEHDASMIKQDPLHRFVTDDNIANWNGNETTERIDANVTDIKDKIGSTSDTGGTESTGSVFGKLNAILQEFKTYWTPTRVGKLDNLNTTISSRAPASTALSNATWTDERAGKMDNLNTTVSSRAPASTALSNATWTSTRAAKLDKLDSIYDAVTSNSGCVKSVQRGTLSAANTNERVTISRVDTSKSMVIINGGQIENDCDLPILYSLSSTALTIERIASSISWQVVEFY